MTTKMILMMVLLVSTGCMEAADDGACLASESATVQATTLSACSVVPSDPAHPGAAFAAGTWTFTSGSYMYYPIANVPSTLAGYAWTVRRNSPAATVTASILELWPGGTALTVPGSKLVDATGTTGDVTLTVSGLDYAPAAGDRYVLRVAESGGDGTDSFTSALLFTP